MTMSNVKIKKLPSHAQLAASVEEYHDLVKKALPEKLQSKEALEHAKELVEHLERYSPQINIADLPNHVMNMFMHCARVIDTWWVECQSGKPRAGAYSMLRHNLVTQKDLKFIINVLQELQVLEREQMNQQNNWASIRNQLLLSGFFRKEPGSDIYAVTGFQEDHLTALPYGQGGGEIVEEVFYFKDLDLGKFQVVQKQDLPPLADRTESVAKPSTEGIDKSELERLMSHTSTVVVLSALTSITHLRTKDGSLQELVELKFNYVEPMRSTVTVRAKDQTLQQYSIKHITDINAGFCHRPS